MMVDVRRRMRRKMVVGRWERQMRTMMLALTVLQETEKRERRAMRVMMKMLVLWHWEDEGDVRRRRGARRPLESETMECSLVASAAVVAAVVVLIALVELAAAVLAVEVC